jgi:Iron/manganese superoxide dismutases, C-terminal domain
MGKALGGGSGWVLLTWSPRAGKLVNQWAACHTMTIADGCVLVALDMYEHAYQMDFGVKAAAYVDAWMNVLSWRHADKSFAGLNERRTEMQTSPWYDVINVHCFYLHPSDEDHVPRRLRQRYVAATQP